MQIRFPLAIDHARESLVLSTYSERIKLTGMPPDLGVTVLAQINDGNSVDDIVASLPESDDTIRSFIEKLKAEALVCDSIPGFYTGRQMIELLRFYYQEWNDILFSHRLWTSLADGSAAESVVNGWLIESYHFIRGANVRLNYAASLAQDERVKKIFSRHYIEEYDHYKFFAESLRRRGIDVRRLRSGPLASTTAVANMARRAARSDCLAYAACSGLLESTGSDPRRARGFYSSVASHFDKTGTRFVEPLIKHVDIDEEYDHGSVMADVFGPIKMITAERADSIVATASLFRETLSLWFADVELYYFLNPHHTKSRAYSYRSNPPA